MPYEFSKRLIICPRFGRSVLDPYKSQLLEWWNAGIREPSILMQFLKPCGFEGSLRTYSATSVGYAKRKGYRRLGLKSIKRY